VKKLNVKCGNVIKVGVDGLFMTGGSEKSGKYKRKYKK